MANGIPKPTPPFLVKDCALASIATGIKAQTLGEFRDQLKTIPAQSIYYHFWRQTLETTLAPGSFYNDFSHWAHYHLHDDILAERLALIDPSEYTDMEKLRSDVIEIFENRIDEQDILFCFYAEPFHFVQSKIVVFNTSLKMEQPKDLVKTIPKMSHSSIFYHFIDSRRRDQVALDDFSSWLHEWGPDFHPLVEHFEGIDPYFIPLVDLQEKLISIVTNFFLERGDK